MSNISDFLSRIASETSETENLIISNGKLYYCKKLQEFEKNLDSASDLILEIYDASESESAPNLDMLNKYSKKLDEYSRILGFAA